MDMKEDIHIKKFKNEYVNLREDSNHFSIKILWNYYRIIRLK